MSPVIDAFLAANREPVTQVLSRDVSVRYRARRFDVAITHKGRGETAVILYHDRNGNKHQCLSTELPTWAIAIARDLMVEYGNAISRT